MDDSTTTTHAAAADVLREVASLLSSLPDDVPAPMVTYYGGTSARPTVDVHWYLELAHVSDDQRGDLGRIVRAVGGAWTKDASDDDFTMRHSRGALRLLVKATRQEVCTRRVVGTREVTRTIPAQPAIPATSEHTVTETVEDVEWECEPVLALVKPVPA